jgi:alpha-D-glucose phosphate-specific phosphoglucomutase
MNTTIRFGTDGWRGIIAQDFTFDNVRACAKAVAEYLKQAKLDKRGLLIGYDNRFASEDFAAAVAEVVAANGVKVYLCPHVTPTPVISYGVLAKKAGGAVIITASHNPAIWNGFKYKSQDGTSAPSVVTAQLEKNLARIPGASRIESLPLPQALERGIVEHLDLEPLYTRHLTQLIDLEPIRRSKLKVVFDAMYGAGAGYLQKLLGGGAMQLVEINGERNPLFPGINPEPIEPNLDKLSATVKREKAAVGLATDGDADRLGVIDEKGNFLTQLQVFALLSLYLLEVRGERGAIVRTLTSTTMLDRLGELFGVPVYETPVGFKYVAPMMTENDAIIGGEESGGYGFRGHMPERDGLLAGIYFLDLILKTGKTPSQLVDYLYNKVGPHYYHRRDFTFPEEQRRAITKRITDNMPRALGGVAVKRVDTEDGFRLILADTSWLFIRFSGTEPVLRVYAESDSPARVESLLDEGRKLAGI